MNNDDDVLLEEELREIEEAIKEMDPAGVEQALEAWMQPWIERGRYQLGHANLER